MTDLHGNCVHVDTADQKKSGYVRVHLPTEQVDYPRSRDLIMGLLEAGFALLPIDGVLHAKHRMEGTS